MQSHGRGLLLNCIERFLFCIPSYAIDQREGGRKEGGKAWLVLTAHHFTGSASPRAQLAALKEAELWRHHLLLKK